MRTSAHFFSCFGLVLVNSSSLLEQGVWNSFLNRELLWVYCFLIFSWPDFREGFLISYHLLYLWKNYAETPAITYLFKFVAEWVPKWPWKHIFACRVVFCWGKVIWIKVPTCDAGSLSEDTILVRLHSYSTFNLSVVDASLCVSHMT